MLKMRFLFQFFFPRILEEGKTTTTKFAITQGRIVILLHTNLAICNIQSFVDITKRPAAYFLLQFIFPSNDKLRASAGRFLHFRNLIITLKQNTQKYTE